MAEYLKKFKFENEIAGYEGGIWYLNEIEGDRLHFTRVAYKYGKKMVNIDSGIGVDSEGNVFEEDEKVLLELQNYFDEKGYVSEK